MTTALLVNDVDGEVLVLASYFTLILYIKYTEFAYNAYSPSYTIH